ncbi:hypothetical protein ACFWZ7_26180 [Nocardiopsis alba]|uniref:hypothetical protein n=1 Tax=Nocardiopsis alba TaxID=53437 RepID=UPI00366BB120
MKAGWRTRLRAAAGFADHLLFHLDSLISARLDIRPIRSQLMDLASWLGQTWRAHLHAAHVRRYGPGRGVIAVVINRPNTTTNTTNEKEAPGER